MSSVSVAGQRRALVIALLALGVLTFVTALTQSMRQAALLIVGALLGVALYHAAFGFTAAFRVLIADGRGAGVRAQMIMLGLACLLFFPALAAGHVFGQPVAGFVAPAGLGVAVGAFLFGVGMQLGGACGSGTLFTVGGGSVRMVMTLAFFIIGSLIGLAHLPFWESLPGPPAISLVEQFGWAPALVAHGAVFAAIWGATVWLERARHGFVQPIARLSATSTLRGRLLRGPWPLIAGAVALALLNFATLVLAGRPWGVTAAFALWGAKILASVGAPVGDWASWSDAGQQAALSASVLADVTSVMDFGVMLGAFAAAAAARRFAPDWRIPPRHIAASVIGGLLLGYGARLAYGCNVGAFFSGIASGSLHGWLWIVCALAGNALGVGLRPAFAMPVERLARKQ